jgi:DUF971 family protein
LISPTEIKYRRAERLLDVTFDDGSLITLPAEFLRVESPSAEVQGHRPEDKVLVTGKADVTITAIEPVGNYAIRLIFSDGHDTGIFSWDYLRLLHGKQDHLWSAYLAALKAAGLHR